MTILQTRYVNAKKLADQIGGQSRFAEKVGMSRQQVSHLIGSRPVKGIGHHVARRIEQAFEVPIGWLDVDNDRPARLADTYLDVPVMDTYIDTTPGDLQPESEQSVQMMRLSKTWIKQNIAATAFDYLAILTAKGDSMEPTFSDGSLLLVDRGVTAVKIDAIYVMARGDDLYIKRVQRNIRGGLTIKSDNPNYDDIVIESTAKAGLLVLGRVVLAWNSKKL